MVTTIDEQLPSATQLFKRSWHTYGQLIENNYMFHHEIGTSVNRALKEFFADRPIKVLDLGCGDASSIKTWFDGVNVDSYYGCDLSPEALAIAQKNLPEVVANFSLAEADMLQYINQLDDQVDFVISGFAMHHLNFSDKKTLIQKSKEKLSAAGAFVLIDIFRELEQTRKAYLQAYLDYADQNWSRIGDDGMKLISDHVQTYDYPETVSTCLDLAHNAGFKKTQLLTQHTWHGAVIFTGS